MRRRAPITALLFAVAAFPASSFAHGINAHVWASDRAIDLVTDCTLYELLADPAVRPAAQISPSFPDSGYAADHPYGEAAHWEPWTEAYRTVLAAEWRPGTDDLTMRKAVAFWMGASAHGIEDEIFDTIFIAKSEEVDGVGQDLLDTFTDFLMAGEGMRRCRRPSGCRPASPRLSPIRRSASMSTTARSRAACSPSARW